MNRFGRCVIESAHRGAAMEDSMAVDVVLWFILAAAVAWIYCGCIFTAREKTQARLRDERLERQFDRAA
jgi:hypothetical protein